MVRVSPASYSAVSGELSKLMFGRRDFVRFQNGARSVRGFMVLPEGPVTRLPGTRFMGFTHEDRPARLMSFAFSDEDAMMLEWTDGLLRFWRHGALVMSGPAPYAVVTPYAAGDLARLRSLQSADRVYMVDGEHRPQRLSRFGLSSWTIGDTPFKGGPFAPRNIDENVEVLVSGVTGVVNLTASAPLFGPQHVGGLFQIFEIDTSDTPYWEADVAASIGDTRYYSGRVYRIVAFDGQNGVTGPTLPTLSGGPPPDVSPDNQVQWTRVSDGNPLAVPARSPSEAVSTGSRRFIVDVGSPGGGITAEVSGFIVQPGSRNTGVNPPVHLEGRWLSGMGAGLGGAA
ncbi:hypothetical protein MASR1M32_10630 [Rhodobacter sp.]